MSEAANEQLQKMDAAMKAMGCIITEKGYEIPASSLAPETIAILNDFKKKIEKTEKNVAVETKATMRHAVNADELKACGATVRTFISESTVPTFFVRASDEAIERIRAIPWVLQIRPTATGSVDLR